MKKSRLPKTDSIQELAEFWDTHDFTDFEDEFDEVTEPVFVRASQATRVRNMSDHVHVFVGCFKNQDAACEYSEPQWEPEPADSVSDQEYAAWEARNPSWQMLTDLGVSYLDSDFIETIHGDHRYEYFRGMLIDSGEIDRIRSMSESNENTYVLIYSEALGGFEARMKSTPRLKYCGPFRCKRYHDDWRTTK